MSVPWYDRLLAGFARLTNRRTLWFRMPFPLSLANLVGVRVYMRNDNLYDCETAPSKVSPPEGFDIRGARTANGSFNDLAQPWMGMAGTRFGRNCPIEHTHGEAEPGLYEPNPRLVSSKLLARRDFIPAGHLNVLVPAWLQFMVHDWLSHGPNDTENLMRFPRPEGDDWPTEEVTVPRSHVDPTRSPTDEGRPTTYTNHETHWWDGSQIYGSSDARLRLVRTDPATGEVRPDGKLHLDDNGHLPIDKGAKHEDQELAGVNGAWWPGLSVFHTIFAREHNAIVDRIAMDHPDRAKDGEWLFQKARLVNAALMAKIHTIEWTPALMESTEGRLAMRANWWGLAGEQFSRAYGRISDSEILSGIPGSPCDHHAAPYAMTEEFTAVYRMHSLIPDEFSFRHRTDDAPLKSCNLGDIAQGGVKQLYREVEFADVLYSLATSPCGAPVLHNFPNILRKIPEPAKPKLFNDLGTIDILRDRERGVPRYCAMRRHLGMIYPRTFADLTANKDDQKLLREIYGDVEKVDLLVGTLAEAAPPGFAFSDTAFRIFVLMASRRLKSDRFFTDDFTPEVYTPAGFAWVRDNSLKTVLTRHMPHLVKHFADLRNPFSPWARGTG
jgi:hypothetical protein